MKKISSMAGIVLSIAIIVMGICTYSSADEFFRASFIEFGADFYTEIFEEVEQVKASARSIDNAINRVGGLLLISIGGISLFGFLNVLSDTLDKSNKKSKTDVEDATKSINDNTQIQ